MHLPNENVEIKNLIAQTHSLASLFGYDDDEKAGVVKQKGIRGFFLQMNVERLFQYLLLFLYYNLSLINII